MSTSPQVPTAAYQACIDEALRQAPFMIKRWYTRLAETLYDKSTAPVVVSEKRQIHDAWVALKSKQAAIEQGFTRELTQAMALDTKSANATKADQVVRSFSSLRFDDLELMGDAQVQETLDEARLQQVFLLASDAGLTGFSARLSTAQGYKVVKSDKNPLRPEIMSRAMANLLLGLSVDAEIRARWLVYGAQLMGNELQALYVLLNELLEKLGVDQASYVVISSPDEPGRRHASHGNQASADDQSRTSRAPPDQPVMSNQGGQGTAGADVDTAAPLVFGGNDSVRVSREQLLTLDHLHRLMVGGYDDAFSTSMGAPTGDATIASLESTHFDDAQTESAALDALAELEKNIKRTSAGKAGKKVRFAPPQPVALIREQFKTDTKNLGQSLAIEVVGLMIEQLASDERLLPPVRQVIANAEPAFLRLGITDPRFFSDKSHPARQLLEAITAKAMAYASEDAPSFSHFMQDLNAIAVLLTEEDASDAKHFEVLLHDFEGRQARRNQAVVDAQKLAVQALLQAEQRNLLAEKIATEIRSRSDFVTGHPAITSFITGPWAQVMAKERLMGEHGGLGQRKAVFSLTLGDLLWSLDLAQATKSRKRLIKILPGMLESVRDGLLSIDFPLAHSKAFFDELMRLHAMALTAVVPAAPATDLEPAKSKKRSELDQAFAEKDAVSSKQPWLAPDEAHQSGFMDFDDKLTRPSFQATVPQQQTSSRNVQEDLATALPGEPVDMQLGDWVELASEIKWIRAQLTWISPHNTLFMFTSEGGRSHSMTSRMLQQLMSRGRFKIISQQGVMDGAFDSVARAAVRNSVDVLPGA